MQEFPVPYQFSGMGLEQDIQQKTFRNEYQKATINLLYTNSWLENKLSAFFKNHNLTLQQYNVLRILKGQYPQPISTSDLRERMLDRMSDASRIVDRLHKKKLLLRKVCQKDKRKVDIVLSDHGIEVMDSLEKVVVHLDGFLSQLKREEVQQLNFLLDKLRG